MALFRVKGFRFKTPASLLEKTERTADGFAFSSMDVLNDVVREVREVQPDGSIKVEYRRWKKTKRQRELFAGMLPPTRCRAQTRRGTACKHWPLPGRTRCKYHGGLSTGPRTPEGRARIGESNRRRAEIKRANLAKSGEIWRDFRAESRKISENLGKKSRRILPNLAAKKCEEMRKNAKSRSQNRGSREARSLQVFLGKGGW
jgi:hypothetical protein